MSSSRRSSGEVNILAMLDGLGARRPARRKLRWYGVGGVLASALVGTLAWMVHDPAPVTGQPKVADALPAPVVTAADTAPAPAVAPRAPGGATVVNLPAVAGADARPAPDHVFTRAHGPAPAPKAAPAHPTGRTGIAAAHPATHPAPKRTARANRSGAAPAAMDTDVALITAIIQHASSQHGGAEDGCADKPCAPPTPARP